MSPRRSRLPEAFRGVKKKKVVCIYFLAGRRTNQRRKELLNPSAARAHMHIFVEGRENFEKYHNCQNGEDEAT